MSNKAKAVAVGVLLAVSAIAHAAVSPADIASAVKSGNLSGARALATQATQEHPSSAKAWYLLAEVDSRLGQGQEGLAALNRAKTLEPTLKFASNPQFVAQLQNDLNREAGATSNGSRMQAPMARTQSNAGQMTMLGMNAPVKHESSSHAFLYIILIALAVFIVVAVMWFSRKKKQDEKLALDRLDTARRGELAKMVDAQTRIASLLKDLRFEQKSDSQLGVDAKSINTDINSEVDELLRDDGSGPWRDRQRQRDLVLRALSDAERRANMKQYDGVAPAAATATERIAQVDEQKSAAQAAAWRRENESLSRPSSGYGPGYGYAPAPAPQQGPVIINNGNSGSGDGLLTGMLLGEMMGEHHDRVIEREVIREPADNGYNRGFDGGNGNSFSNDDDDELRRRGSGSQSDGGGLFDTGSGSDSSWSDSSSDSGSFDSGGGDSGGGWSDD